MKTKLVMLCMMLLTTGVFAAAITNSIHLSGQTVDGVGPINGTFNATFNVSLAADCSGALDTASTTFITDADGNWAYFFDTSVVESSQQYIGYNINRTSDGYNVTGCFRYAPVAYAEQVNPANDYQMTDLNLSGDLNFPADSGIEFNSGGVLSRRLDYDSATSRLEFTGELYVVNDFIANDIHAVDINANSVLPNDIGTTGQTTFYGNGSQLTGISTVTYWNRTGTVLEPATSGDDINVTGAIYTEGGITAQGGSQFFGRSSNFPQFFLGSATMTGTGYIDTQNARPLALNTLAGNRAVLVGDAGLYPDTTDATALGDTTNRWGSLEVLEAEIGNATDYVDIATDGQLTLFGNARVLKTIEFYPYNIGGIAGTYNGITNGASGLGSLNGYYFKTFDDGQGVGTAEASQVTIHLPGDYVDGTDLVIEVSTTVGGVSTNDVRWQAGEAHTSDTDTYSPQTYTWATPQNVAGPGTAWEREDVSFTLSGTGMVGHDDVSIIIFRDADNAADTYVGDAYLATLDIMYTSDKIGE